VSEADVRVAELQDMAEDIEFAPGLDFHEEPGPDFGPQFDEPEPAFSSLRPVSDEALEVLTAAEVYQLPDPPGSGELLGSLVVRGQRVILGGHTGEGKTTAKLAIVRAIATKSRFLDWTGAGGRALVIDAEQGLKTIKRRLREAGLSDCPEVDYVRVPDGLALDSDPHHVAEVERILAAGGYAVVAADPLYKLHAGDSNDEREAVKLMRRFDGWREQFGFALVLPVHCRKPIPGSKFSIHDIFGSSAYVRGAEVVLGLQRVSNGLSRLHFLKDRDGDLPIGDKWELLFDQANGYRRKPDEPERDLAADVETFLRGVPCAPVEEIREAVEARAQSVREVLRGSDQLAQVPCRRTPLRHHPNSKCWALTEGVVPLPGTEPDVTLPLAEGLVSSDPLPPLGGKERDETDRQSRPDSERDWQ
jgi:hypothetical protein